MVAEVEVGAPCIIHLHGKLLKSLLAHPRHKDFPLASYANSVRVEIDELLLQRRGAVGFGAVSERCVDAND